MDVDSGGASPVVSRVRVAKRQVIPPNSVVKIKCKLDQELTSYVVEPLGKARLMIPRVLREGGTDPIICVINPSDRYRLAKKGMEIGRAFPIAEVLQEQGSDPDMDQEGSPLVCEVTKEEVGLAEDLAVPSHVQAAFDQSCENLTEAQSGQLASVLRQYGDVFACSEFDLGDFTEIEHEVDTGDAKPVKQGLRRTPICFAGEEEAHLKKMLDAGVIQESTSDWSSAPVLIRKRDGAVRWCIDYRALNDVTVKDVFPLPLVDDCLDTLAGTVWFSKLDANSAYWQVKIKESDRKKTAFITKYGLFEHVRMGFGLCNSPATYARCMNLVLRGLTWKTVMAFLDDVIVLGRTFEEHLANLEETLQRFRKYNLRLKPKKVRIFPERGRVPG